MRETKTEAFDVTAESGIIAIWQREKFKLDRVFSEFIDNSLQSYLDHKEQLNRLDDGKKCVVTIVWDALKIVVTDNAFGMNQEEFARALKPKATNPNAWRNNQLSVYGLGLKYASVYLGDHYSITSTRYGSTIQYFAEVDVPTFEQQNPKTVDAILSETFSDEHETKLEITSLRIKQTPDKVRDLREKLGIIYQQYIRNGDLDILINGVKVTYERPKLRPNDEGGLYFERFASSFVAGDKKYEFEGWIGLLNKGGQDITGLNLMQAKRCIELGYKPEKLFGKGNSFENSRLVGEVTFNGENYVLSFNKDGFVWADDGAEAAFIDALMAIPEVKYIKKKAHELRYPEEGNKIKKKTQDVFKNNTAIVLTPPSKQIESNADKDKVSTVAAMSQKSDATSLPQEMPLAEDDAVDSNAYDTYKVVVNGKEMPLFVDIDATTADADWVSLEKHKDGYLLHINSASRFVSSHFTTQAAMAASHVLAIVLATGMLQAQNLGLRLTEATLLLKAINEIMGK